MQYYYRICVHSKICYVSVGFHTMQLGNRNFSVRCAFNVYSTICKLLSPCRLSILIRKFAFFNFPTVARRFTQRISRIKRLQIICQSIYCNGVTLCMDVRRMHPRGVFLFDDRAVRPVPEPQLGRCSVELRTTNKVRVRTYPKN